MQLFLCLLAELHTEITKIVLIMQVIIEVGSPDIIIRGKTREAFFKTLLHLPSHLHPHYMELTGLSTPGQYTKE